MAETEQVPLLEQVDESTLPPPPPYQPSQECEITIKIENTKPAAVKIPEKPIPLPTYEQSQKYEQDGVLEVEEDEPKQTSQRSSCISKPPGTCLDFTLFFLLCSFFGLIGFIFSICLAFTVAAESGAMAGFGLALIFKLFAFETYDTAKFYNDGCEAYYGVSDHTKELCMRRLFYITRVLFWLMGIFGLYLLCKGFHRYSSSRSRRQVSPPAVTLVDSD